MNSSPSSSSLSPPAFKSNSRPQSSTNRETPSIIPLDYNYKIMAPSHLRPQTSRYSLVSRSSTRQSNTDVDVDMDEDLPYSSLFGDPVPPPPPDDFLTSTFQASHYLRSTSVELTSEEEQTLGKTMTLSKSSVPQRLFPQVPYTTLMGRRFSNSSSQRNFEIMPSNIPKLKPPDIQILPNSSGGSSSDPHNSPNYMLLTPHDVNRKSMICDNTDEAADVSELKETYTISDANSVREFTQTTRKSATPKDSENMQILSPPQIFDSSLPRTFSNESYSSAEWFRTANLNYPEFNKMPKLRPSSKNVMSIKRDEMPMNSPVAAMINDSNGSSSGEERLMEATQTLDKPTVCLDSLKPPERPPSPSPSCLRSLEETIVLAPREYIKQRRKSTYPTQLVEQEPVSEEDKPPPIPPKPHLVDENVSFQDQPQTPLKREVSPVIIKDSITTGGDYRVDQSRLHKKTSFTIINDKSPQSSRAQSPRFLRTREHTSSSLIPTPQMRLPKHQLQRKSLSSTQLKLPYLVPSTPNAEIIAGDSPRHSVQFNMSGRHSLSKLQPQKGILQHKESLISSQDSMTTQQMRRRPSILPKMVEKTRRPQVKSCEALPMITDPYRTSIPRLNRSTLELGPESAVFPPGALPRPLKPNPNPTRKQKGLLKVINHEEALSRLPLKSNWASMDDLWLDRKRTLKLSPIHDKTSRRRSSSTSPSRRSSTQTTSDRRSSNLSSVTTSDFSFRRSSTTKPKTPQSQRKKSIYQLPSPASRRKSSSTSSILTTQSRPTRTKISKPTTLSPIIGTPNRDSSSGQSPSHAIRPAAPASDSVSDSNSRRDSISKIPIRSQANSRSNSRISSHGGSRASSRTGSPSKNYSAGSGQSRTVSPMKVYQDTGGRISQTGSRQPPLAGNIEGYSRSVSPMREFLETGGRISQMDINDGLRSRSGSPIKEFKERGGRSSQSAIRGSVRSKTGSPTKDLQETGRRSRIMKNHQDATEGCSSRMALSRSGSRASQYLTSQPGSRAQSRANSRSQSRSTSRASTRPVSLPDSRPTSRMEQARDIANSRSNSRLSMHSIKKGGVTSPKVGRKTPTKSISARTKSISLSPKGNRRGTNRRGSVSPVSKKTRGGRSRSRSKAYSSPVRIANSRIPVSHTNGRSSTRSPPSKKKLNVTTDLRRTASLKTKVKSLKKQPASAKKIPTSVRKFEPSVKRTPSSVGKQSAATKKQTNVVQKPPVDKKETSIVLQKPTMNFKPLSKEATSLLVIKKALSRKAAALSKRKANETQSDKKDQIKANKDGGENNENNMVSTSGAKEHDIDETVALKNKTENNSSGSTAATVAVPVLTTLKRQPSSISLMRVSSKISLLKKRSDSNISKKTLDVQVSDQESAVVEAPSPTQQIVEMALAEGGSIPAAIIEKSQKTLENIQKTVTEATEEIHKTINENLTDLKSLEQDMGLTSDSAGSPTPSVTTVVEKKSGSTKQKGLSVSRLGTAEGPEGKTSPKSPLPPTQPIEASVSVLNSDDMQTTSTKTTKSNGASKHEATKGAGASERVSERAISVLPEVDCESANLQSFQGATAGDVDGKVQSAAAPGVIGMEESVMRDGTGGGAADDYETEAKRRSPDGQGGSQVGSGKGSASQEYLENKSLSGEDEVAPKGCCRCCAKFCMPCRRLRCSRCCQRKKSSSTDEAEQPVLSATSSATTTHLEIIDEKEAQKSSCWQKINCCKSCRKKSKDSSSSTFRKEEEIKETSFRPMGPPKQSKCGLCLSKIFCCRSVNKIDPKTGDETEVKKCCFCIPCRKKREMAQSSAVSSVAGGSTAAWEDPERGITATDAAVLEGQDMEAKPSCCSRFCNFLLCCRKKKVAVTDSRRASIRAPPPEDNRRKLHADLIEYTSKMKGAIPVLPLWLAWFCAICNAVVPGLGTLLSGLFCLCVGIPRFSQYDSAKARLGSFIINTIVAVSQLFCVLFCFVGWGWSIWWGTIMLKCARKLHKIRKVERLEIEEEKRQQAAAEVAAAATTKTTAQTQPQPPPQPQPSNEPESSKS